MTFLLAPLLAIALAQPANVTAQPISLDLQKAEIHGVLRLFSTFAGINIVAGDDVKGTVTVRLVDVPWDQALAAVLAAKGYAAVSMKPNAWVVQPALTE